MLFSPFLVSSLAICVLKRFSNKVGLLDMPGGRKEHKVATPLVGGIAIYLGILAGILCLTPTGVWHHDGSFVLASLCILVIGVVDDAYDVSPYIRFAVQLGALSLMIYWGGVQVHVLGNIFGHGNIGLTPGWSTLLTLFGAATLINAMNMLDGLDGLAGGLALTMLASLAGIAFLSGQMLDGQILVMISSAVLAFLCFNFPWRAGQKASVFMGDAGSTLLGFMLAWFTIKLSQQPGSIATPPVMLWVVAVPLMDLAVVFLLRLREGRSPFKPGSEHIYYRLMGLGLNRAHTTWVMVAISLITQLIVWIWIQQKSADAMVFGGFLTVFLIYLLASVLQFRRKST